MLRPAILLVLAVALQGANAQQVESHGPPASVLSPGSPGTAHSVPSSVTSPTSRTLPNGRAFRQRRPRVLFGSPHARRPRHEFVAVPIFAPLYLNPGYVDSEDAVAQDAPPDEPQEDAGPDAEALREAYNRGAHDALAQQRDSRYGEHYLDAREQNQSRTNTKSGAAEQTSDAKDAGAENASSTAEPDNAPATVFIFKDGHKIETQNYAIVGETLFDFSNNAMRKINLTDLDFDATRKANNDLGITVKLPSSM